MPKKALKIELDDRVIEKYKYYALVEDKTLEQAIADMLTDYAEGAKDYAEAVAEGPQTDEATGEYSTQVQNHEGRYDAGGMYKPYKPEE